MPTIASLLGEPTNNPIVLNNKNLLSDWHSKLPNRMAPQGFAAEITVIKTSLFDSQPNQKQFSTPFLCINLTVHNDNALLERLSTLFIALPKTECISEAFLNITLKQTQNGWAIIANENLTVIDNLETLETAPFILDLVMMIYYRQSNYQVAFHGSAVQFKGHNLFFPALSGSGKSTLFGHFNQQGAIPFSDEVIVLDSEFSPIPVPFPMTLKSGSWPLFPDFAHNPTIWKRPDGRMLKYYSPSWQSPVKSLPESLIFPQYSLSDPESIQAIGPCKSLQKIGLAGYEFFEEENEWVIDELLKWLDRIPVFEVFYHHCENAEQMIWSQLK